MLETEPGQQALCEYLRIPVETAHEVHSLEQFGEGRQVEPGRRCIGMASESAPPAAARLFFLRHDQL
jgi:hypothetical protein